MLCSRKSRTCAYVPPFPAGIVSMSREAHDFTLRKEKLGLSNRNTWSSPSSAPSLVKPSRQGLQVIADPSPLSPLSFSPSPICGERRASFACPVGQCRHCQTPGVSRVERTCCQARTPRAGLGRAASTAPATFTTAGHLLASSQSRSPHIKDVSGHIDHEIEREDCSVVSRVYSHEPLSNWTGHSRGIQLYVTLAC